MNQINNYNSDKSLPDLFKEVQDIRYGRARPKADPIENVKFNKVYVVDKRFNVVGAVIGILFVIMFFTIIQSNYIFATTVEEKVAIAEYEKNEHKIEIMEILSNNISELTKKEIVTSEVEIPYNTTYIENNLLPLNEEKIIQEGVVGYLDQTIIKTYENEELINENIISEITKSEPVEEIIEKGTSEFLYENQVHIGDILYTTEDTTMYSKPDGDEDDEICLIYEHIDVELISEENGWCNIAVDGLEGYVKNDVITSENVTPGIAELSRKKRILIGVNTEMEVNCPSGLTKEDFIKVLSNHREDTDKVIENNAEAFYEAEQKYNVNGLFLASMAIHESNWGTSNIARQKKNLFGYGSYDSSAYTSSYTFESYQYGIDLVAKVLAKYYLNEQGTPIYDDETAVGSYYNGPTISGVNTRYASDSNWSNRVYSIMESLYQEL